MGYDDCNCGSAADVYTGVGPAQASPPLPTQPLIWYHSLISDTCTRYKMSAISRGEGREDRYLFRLCHKANLLCPMLVNAELPKARPCAAYILWSHPPQPSLSLFQPFLRLIHFGNQKVQLGGCLTGSKALIEHRSSPCIQIMVTHTCWSTQSAGPSFPHTQPKFWR